MEKYRCRNFNLVLYPDCEEHVKALEKIKKEYDYAMILHDKDMNEDGEIKKAHYHVVIKMDNAKWNTAVAKELGIPENYVGEKVRGLDNVLLYLIHYNNPEKYQYPIEDVKGNLKDRIKMAIGKDDKQEGEKVIDLINYIESQDKYISVKSFARYAAENGVWDVYRRAGAIFNTILQEHNCSYNKGDSEKIEMLEKALSNIIEKGLKIDVE